MTTRLARLLFLSAGLLAPAAQADEAWPERMVRIEDMKRLSTMRIAVPRDRPSGDVVRPCVLKVHVDKDGNVRRVWVEQTSGSPGHDRAAMKAMKTQRFEPHLVDGEPAAVTLVVPLDLPKNGLRAEP